MRTEPKLTAPTDYAVVYRLAFDIADAMAAIHRLNIMHGVGHCLVRDFWICSNAKVSIPASCGPVPLQNNEVYVFAHSVLLQMGRGLQEPILVASHLSYLWAGLSLCCVSLSRMIVLFISGKHPVTLSLVYSWKIGTCLQLLNLMYLKVMFATPDFEIFKGHVNAASRCCYPLIS